MTFLQEIFSTRPSKTLLLVPDKDVFLEQIVTVLDRLQEASFLHNIILLTPKQGNDIRDEFCIMDAPAG